MGRKVRFFRKNWKLMIHLLWKTDKFGVNNKRTVPFNSFFGGWSNKDKVMNTLKVKPFLRNYRCVKLRATQCGFLTREECEMMGWKKWV